MAASAEEPVAGSILEHAKKDAETLDWLSIPADQRIIGDKPKRTKLLVVVCLEVRIPSNSWQAQIHEGLILHISNWITVFQFCMLWFRLHVLFFLALGSSSVPNKPGTSVTHSRVLSSIMR